MGNNNKKMKQEKLECRQVEFPSYVDWWSYEPDVDPKRDKELDKIAHDLVRKMEEKGTWKRLSKI